MTRRQSPQAALVAIVILAAAGWSAAIPPKTATITPSSRLSWRLLGPDNEPVRGYRFRLTSESSGLVAESRPTDEEGSVQLPVLVPGRYGVTLLTSDRRPCDTEFSPIQITDQKPPEFTTVLARQPECANERIKPAFRMREPGGGRGRGP
jgi:hypothetical protein